jgi:hypothetical protein
MAHEVRIDGRLLVSPSLLPRTSLGGAIVTSGDATSHVGWAVGAVGFPTVRTPSPDTGFGFGLSAAWIHACSDPVRAPRVSVSLCAGFATGIIHAVTYERQPTIPGDRAWYALDAEALLRASIVGPVYALGGVLATTPLVRHRFFIENRPGTVFREPYVAPSGFLGGGVAFR